MKAKIKPVNDMAVSDEHLSIIILKKPKRRYRQIIKAYYRRVQKKGVSRRRTMMKSVAAETAYTTDHHGKQDI